MSVPHVLPFKQRSDSSHNFHGLNSFDPFSLGEEQHELPETMTSWIWMKGVSVAIADPIDPVTPEDVRPSVKALIDEHRVKIDKIKGEISSHALYDANKHDDLWILHFWLSHKKTKKAVAAALHTLEYRQKYNLDEQDIRHDTPHLSSEPRVAESKGVDQSIICGL